MKSVRKYILLELILGILVAAFIGVNFVQKREEEQPRVAVVLSDSGSSQWSSLKYGLEMAAEDQKVDVVFISTEVIESIEEEVKIIQFAVQRGADAVIVQPIPGLHAEQALKDLSPKVPVMLVESAAGYDRNQSYFATAEADAALMGEQLVGELIADCGGSIEGKTVGILSSDMTSDVTREKKSTVSRLLEQQKAEVKWKLTGNLNDAGLVILETQQPVDVVLALDDRSVVMAGKCSADERLHGARVYGIGNSMDAVYYLDNERIECLIVPDEFDVGYQSMSAMAAQLNKTGDGLQNITVGSTVLRREELFSDENQELLFTMSQ